MANKKQKAPADFQRKIVELESIFGTAELGKRLGVSRDSIRRYRTGKTTPQDKSIYQKINRVYGQKKKQVQPEKVQKVKARQKKQSISQKRGRLKSQYASIDDYLQSSSIVEFQEAKNFSLFEELNFSGYAVGWRGRDDEGIPLEVQFLAEGINTPLTRFGNIIKIIAVVNEVSSPKGRSWRASDGEGTDAIRVFSVHFREIRGLNKNTPFDERMELIRDYILEQKIERGYIDAFIGFYFKEGDER